MNTNSKLIIHDVIRQIDDDTGILTKKEIRASNDVDAIKTWLTEFIASPNTFTSYRQVSERFVLWLLQNQLSLRTVTREDIQDYQNFLTNPQPFQFWCGRAVARTNLAWKPFVKGLANSSIKLNLQILTTMYEYLVQSAYLTTNPFRLIKRKSARLTTQNTGIERYLSHQEWQYIQEYIAKMPQKTTEDKMKYYRTKWIFNLLYLSGCRRSEIVNAKMSDFFHKHGGWWLKVIGKGNKYGEIPVTNALLASLSEYRNSIGLTDFPTTTESHISLVNNIQFKNGTRSGITDSMLYKIIKTTCQDIANDLKPIDPNAAFTINKASTHWLRHTSATHQVDAGIDIRVVKENLRHSMLETTMKYQHTEADKRHKETTDKFGNI